VRPTRARASIVRRVKRKKRKQPERSDDVFSDKTRVIRVNRTTANNVRYCIPYVRLRRASTTGGTVVAVIRYGRSRETERNDYRFIACDPTRRVRDRDAYTPTYRRVVDEPDDTPVIEYVDEYACVRSYTTANNAIYGGGRRLLR